MSRFLSFAVEPLAVGTLLYHGTAAVFETIRHRKWFTDNLTTARWYAREEAREFRRCGRVLIFRIVKSPELITIASDEDWQAFMQWTVAGEEEGPFGPPDYQDLYELADMVCDAGYDGWHIESGYPTDRTSEILRAGSDTMVCEPNEFLELVEVRRI